MYFDGSRQRARLPARDYAAEKLRPCVGAYRTLTLHNFRSYTEYAAEFTDGVMIVVGPNGSGKTNLLEALYVLSHGSSFRGADRDMVQRGAEWFRLEATYDGLERTMTCQLGDDGKIEKQFVLDGVKRA